jgi:hypothetical protein
MIIAAREKDFALTAAFGCFVRKECRLAVKRELSIDDLLMYIDKSMLSAMIERALGKSGTKRSAYFEYGWTLYPRATG